MRGCNPGCVRDIAKAEKLFADIELVGDLEDPASFGYQALQEVSLIVMTHGCTGRS